MIEIDPRQARRKGLSTVDQRGQGLFWKVRFMVKLCLPSSYLNKVYSIK